MCMLTVVTSPPSRRSRQLRNSSESRRSTKTPSSTWNVVGPRQSIAIGRSATVGDASAARQA